jgi:transglutaminase-like putative cysteine protease
VIHHVVHITEYLYSERVSTSHHGLHLLPRETPDQKNLSEVLEISPEPAARRDRSDDFGNRETYVEILEPHTNLRITSTSDVEVAPRGPLPETSPPWEAVRDALRAGADGEARAARAYAYVSPHVPLSTAARAYAASSFPPGRPVFEGVRDLTHRLNHDFVYDSRATTIATPVDEVMRLGRGVCQDFAHVQLAGLRALGLAARYVSGYLVTRPPPGKPRLVGADASHAWLAVWVPGHDWIPFDPTNDVVPGEQHITVAWGRDFSDVTPVRGVIMGGGRHDLWVSVDVSPGGPAREARATEDTVVLPPDLPGAARDEAD